MQLIAQCCATHVNMDVKYFTGLTVSEFRFLGMDDKIDEINLV